MRVFLFLLILVFVAFNTSVVSASVSPHYQSVSEQLVNNAEQALVNNDTQQAMILFRQAMVADPKNINTYLGLGKLHSENDEYNLGVKYYDIALSINPIDLNALEGRVRTNLKMNNLASAQESFKTMQQVCEVSVCEQLSSVAGAIDAFKLEKASK